MVTIFWRTLRDRTVTLAAYGGIGTLLVWLYIALFPSIKEQAKELEKITQAYPEELMKAFGLKEGFNFSNLENFLAAEQYSFTWPILVVALVVSWGGAAIAGEIEKSSMDILLAQPISRLRIFLGKYLSGLAALAGFTFVTVFAAVPLAAAYSVDYRLENYIKVAAVGWLFGWAILSLSFFFSSVFNEKGKAYFLSAGAVVIMYVLNIVSNLKENLKDVGYASLFHYFDPNAALIHNEVDRLSYWVLAGTAIILTSLAIIWFKKRDITT